MANSLNTNPIVLDTFTSAIDFSDQYPSGMYVESIEWSVPTTVGHTFQILAGGSSGIPVFDEEATTANQSVIKYFNGERLEPLYLAAASGNEKASGTIIIHLA